MSEGQGCQSARCAASGQPGLTTPGLTTPAQATPAQATPGLTIPAAKSTGTKLRRVLTDVIVGTFAVIAPSR